MYPLGKDYNMLNYRIISYEIISRRKKRQTAKKLLQQNISLFCQWRLVTKISGGAAPDFCIFFINWVMATDIKLKDYILCKYKERINEKRTHYILCYR
jgi:hypothetical protein